MKSSSLYRKIRLKQLLAEQKKIDYEEAAEILEIKKGLTIKTLV